MTIQYAQPADEIVQITESNKVSSKSISQLLKKLENKFSQAQSKLPEEISPDVQFYFNETQKLLIFARDNYEKGFLNVTNSCIRLAENYLERF